MATWVSVQDTHCDLGMCLATMYGEDLRGEWPCARKQSMNASRILIAWSWRFRHSATKHASYFRDIAVLTQLSLESSEPLFDVWAYNYEFTDQHIQNSLSL
jgi:hypothetical protein